MTFPIGLIYSLITLLILLIILLRLSFKRFTSKLRWGYFVIGSMLSFALMWLAGAWPYMSYNFRWLFLALWLIALGLSYYRVRQRPLKATGSSGFSYYFGRSMLTLIVALLIYAFLGGHSYDKAPVPLQFPFKCGKYYVMQGGSNRLTNLFHRFYNRDMFGYAMDIAGLGQWENRSRRLFPKTLNDFVIYKDTVLAPCSGRVIAVENTVEDNLPADFNVRQVHGNHIVIDCGDHRIFMAHLLKDHVFVEVGDEVSAGEPLAILGNSGFTAEPHLHISALRGFKSSDPLSGESVPILFDGKFYALNDVIRLCAD